jgi:Rrf2 family transcriptional regulator, nitric oxide-sensitive transcriptional repressor
MNNILKISDAASLALHAMVIIGQREEKPESVKSISEMLGVSSNHLSKVLQKLVKAGLVTSMKGYGGGFFLVKKPEDVTFLEIYEAIDGKFSPTGCLLNKSTPCSNCIMGNLIKSINKQAKDYFSGVTLADFANKKFNK